MNIAKKKVDVLIPQELIQDHVASIKKGNTWNKTQEECVLPGNKENSRDLYERKHLRFYCTELS